MSKFETTDIIRLLLIVGCILFVIEFIFIDTGLLFIVLLALIAIFYGRKNYYKTSGKSIFWGSMFSLFIIVIDTIAVRFLLLAVIIYLGWKWYQSKPKRSEKVIIPQFSSNFGQEGTAYKNNWFGTLNKGSDEPFAWHDMNLQKVVSDITIDLNNTVLPEEESVIVIRQLIGNITIIVPYDIEIAVEHSVLYGDVSIMHYQEPNAFNKSINFKSEGYKDSPQKVKIFTQVLIGKLEVRRG
ncbi:lia operon protein LiaF [Gracilibacillus ureilyticus]|uniref:Lia operon protein LiaF n=1 Tax=Gracilibacillus ureilyticus TaxID=531814 RepID=A0A1H9SXG1_9BACI|nr:cell wall-active antibiotics response protein LiaF [Gracilibacillus ureilyticus]SER89578.1 lia operon protein LiaF [Gracilibacillus ureilyticus]